ncbi:MAG: molybdopterin-binding protein [Leifsonia sp.]
MSHSPDSPSWDAARAMAWSLGSEHPLPPVTVPLADAVGHAAADDACAVVALPGADLSAMDGWAVSGDGPWTVGAVVRMGGAGDSKPLAAGEARPITTGGVIPPGTTAVLRSEHGVEAERTGAIRLERTRAAAAAGEPQPGRHIRRAGEEIGIGDVLWRAGTTLTPPHIAFGAAAGLDVATVRRRATARLVVTGDEVVRSGAPRPGEVRDAYTPVVTSLLPMLGATLASGHHAEDSHAAVSEAIAHPDGADLVITTGGTGRGSGDWVRHAVLDAGGSLVFDGVRMRPGHPVVLARLADGRPVLALPGNPLAALVCLLSFLPPLVAGMSGHSVAALPELGDLDAEPIEHDTRVIPFRRVGGRAVATSWRGAAMLRGLAEADGLGVIAPQDSPAPPRLLPLPWPGPS